MVRIKRLAVAGGVLVAGVAAGVTMAIVLTNIAGQDSTTVKTINAGRAPGKAKRTARITRHITVPRASIGSDGPVPVAHGPSVAAPEGVRVIGGDEGLTLAPSAAMPTNRNEAIDRGGSPSESTGSPSHSTGSPSPKSGPPGDQTGTPNDHPSLPTDHPGYPRASSGAPSPSSGLPHDHTSDHSDPGDHPGDYTGPGVHAGPGDHTGQGGSPSGQSGPSGDGAPSGGGGPAGSEAPGHSTLREQAGGSRRPW